LNAAARLRKELLDGFRNGSGAAARFFFAPGRANLLGAHLDYNGGIVLPVALSKGTYAAFSLRSDRLLRLHSAQFPGKEVRIPLEDLHPGRTKGWSAYVEGVLFAVQKKWGPLPGVEARFCSDLPIAKGLSSSASVESVSVLALTRLMGIEATPDEMIGLAHWAENEYAGVRCGILDQAAILLARKDSVLLLDCLEQTREHLPLDSGRVAVAVMDTGVRRELAQSAFNQRVAECTLALARLQARIPGLTCLREVSREDFEHHQDELAPVLQRRVLHVLGEMERTRQGAEALRGEDLAAFGAAVSASHESLRDLYEVSTPELDALWEAARGAEGCYGARLTGAGFGGCVVALVHPGAQDSFRNEVPAAFRRATGRETEVLFFQPGGGPRELE